MRTIEIDGIEYFNRNNPNGYGYEILSKTPNGTTPKGNPKSIYKLLFQSYNRKLLISIMDRFMEGEVVSEFPDTSNEVPPMVLAVANLSAVVDAGCLYVCNMPILFAILSKCNVFMLVNKSLDIGIASKSPVFASIAIPLLGLTPPNCPTVPGTNGGGV